MTNEQIIWNKRMELMENGIIGDTGKEIQVKDETGTIKTVKMPEEIHTYMGWAEYGRQVKKGEKAICNLIIWKHTVKKAKDEGDEDEERMFQTRAYFFKESQTTDLE